MRFSTLDVFCHVIDNYGDAGVALRFCREFKRQHADCTVRLFIDDITALLAITRGLGTTCPRQDSEGFSVVNLSLLRPEEFGAIVSADIIIEAFACYLPEWYLDKAYEKRCLIINLDYLSAEPWTAGYHLKESLLPRGRAKKHFYMPGFTNDTGGIIPNAPFSCARLQHGAFPAAVRDQLRTLGCHGDSGAFAATGTVFTYEKSFDALLRHLDAAFASSLLFCFGKKTHTGMQNTLERLGYSKSETGEYFRFGNVSIAFLPFLDQSSFDELLYSTDFNIVRGEDSLARAILAGRPFLWNAYLQDKQYQLVKVDALCTMMEPFFDDLATFCTYRRIMHEFNRQEFEGSSQSSDEPFDLFFENLKKFEHSSLKLCYFVEHNCNLIEKISDFIHAFDFS